MGPLYAIALTVACTLSWLPDETGRMATWRIYEPCARQAEYLRTHMNQQAECLMIPRAGERLAERD